MPDRKTNYRTEGTEARLLVRYGFDLARQLKINKLMVVAELVTDRKMVEKYREDESIIWVTEDIDSVQNYKRKGDYCVEIPHSPVGRMDQVSLALIIAVMKGSVEVDESVVCVVGVAGSKRLDNLLIINPERDFEWFKDRGKERKSKLPISQEFVRLVDIALKFAAEGREGKSIGTVFLLGNIDELDTIARQLILNPCEGHPKKSRNIHDRDFTETLREFSALDGGFLVDRKGTVVAAGVYLDAPVTKNVKVPKGLGSRHLAAAAATAKTDSLAIVISESSGSVTVFFEGARVLSLGKPGSSAT
ncbi:MAG: diadenylate cyclase [Candidatus Pelagisphaera sp.]|jgi:diadenylate cyclase